MASIPLSGSIGVPGNVFILGNTNVVFATDANHTLTSSEYSNQFLEVTGTISATRQLIAPLTQGQVFIVQNNVSDGYSITIGGSSGATVTITNGETLSVVCDGTNYIGTTGTSFVAGGDLTGSNTDQTVVSLTGSSGVVSVIANTLKFANTVSTAVIDQAALASTSSSSGTAGATLLIQAQTGQSATGAGHNGGAGGDLLILGGAGGNSGSASPGAGGSVSVLDASESNGMIILASEGTFLAGTEFVDGYVDSNWMLGLTPTQVILPSLAGNGTALVAINNSGVLSDVPASDGYLHWNGSSFVWSSIGSGFTAGGDLSGTSSSQTVIGIDNTPLSITSLTNGNALLYNGSNWINALIANANVSSSAAIAGTKISPNFGSQNVSTTGTLSAGATTISSLQDTGLSTGVVHSDSSGNFTSSLVVNADVSSSAAVAVSKLAAGTSAQVLLNNSTPTPTWTTLSQDAVISSSGAVTVQGLDTTPIVITSLATNNLLQYNGTDWVNVAPGSLSTVTWADDLSNSSNSAQYVSSLSYSSSSAGGAISINGTGSSLVFASTNTGPVINQASTSSSLAKSMTIQAQSSTNGSGSGGNLNLKSGTGSGSNGVVQMIAGTNDYMVIDPGFGTLFYSSNSTQFVFNQYLSGSQAPMVTIGGVPGIGNPAILLDLNYLVFDLNQTPTIKQVAPTATNTPAPGNPFFIAAQAGTSASSGNNNGGTGGQLVLTSGAGGSKTGTGTAGSAGDLVLALGGTNLLDFSGATPGNVTFVNTAAVPNFLQTALSSTSSASGSAGQAWTITAQAGQAATGASHNGGAGGNLVLSSGIGGTSGSATAGLDGYVYLQGGGTNILQLEANITSDGYVSNTQIARFYGQEAVFANGTNAPVFAFNAYATTTDGSTVVNTVEYAVPNNTVSRWSVSAIAIDVTNNQDFGVDLSTFHAQNVSGSITLSPSSPSMTNLIPSVGYGNCTLQAVISGSSVVIQVIGYGSATTLNWNIFVQIARVQ